MKDLLVWWSRDMGMTFLVAYWMAAYLLPPVAANICAVIGFPFLIATLVGDAIRFVRWSVR